MVAGRSSNVAGGVAGSSTHRVSATPVPMSVALMLGLTENTYQPFTSGLDGLSTIVVTGGIVSTQVAVTSAPSVEMPSPVARLSAMLLTDRLVDAWIVVVPS